VNHKNSSPTDPARSLALLWGSQIEAGRSGLTLKAIIAAAIDIADTNGVDALSMRKVAERLGVGTMSLYTHLPGKADLIDLMFDTAYGELYASVESPSQQPGGWRGALHFIAQQNWDLYHRHPWMLQAATGRSILGPHAALKYEAELRPLDQLGLSDVEMDAVLTLILTHVEGAARAQVTQDRTQQDTRMTDEEWWVSRAPLLDKLIDPARFPVATRVGQAAGQEYQSAFSPKFAFTFGLERILAGIAELISAKSFSEKTNP
jgi:AcrR family transcriptional regulator